MSDTYRPCLVYVIGKVAPTYGAARVLIDLVTAEAQNGNEVVVITSDGSSQENLAVIPFGVRHVHLPRSRGLSGWGRHIFDLRHAFGEIQATRIISFLTLTNLCCILATAFERSSIRVIATEHNIQTMALNRLRHSRAIRFIMLLVYPRADVVVCVSNAVADDIQAIAGRLGVKTRVIENPINRTRIEELASQWSDVVSFYGPTKHDIACVAELKPAKNQALLIDALTYVDHGSRLFLIGGGEDEGKLRMRAEHAGLENRVVFVGRLENPWPLVSRVGLSVLMPAYEGFGLSAAESVASGTPTLCRATGGLAEVAVGLGLPSICLEEMTGAKDVAAAISRLLKNADNLLKREIVDTWFDVHSPARIIKAYNDILE